MDYALGAVACLRTPAVSTAHILGPDGPLPHAKDEADRTTCSGDMAKPSMDGQTRLTTNQPTSQPFCQYPAVSWELKSKTKQFAHTGWCVSNIMIYNFCNLQLCYTSHKQHFFYLRRRLASEGIVTVGITLSCHVCVCPLSRSEGTALCLECFLFKYLFLLSMDGILLCNLLSQFLPAILAQRSCSGGAQHLACNITWLCSIPYDCKVGILALLTQ